MFDDVIKWLNGTDIVPNGFFGIIGKIIIVGLRVLGVSIVIIGFLVIATALILEAFK